MNKKTKAEYKGIVLLVSNVENSKNFYSKLLKQSVKDDFGRCIVFNAGFSIWDRKYAHEVMGLCENNLTKNSNKTELYFEIEDLDFQLKNLKKNKIPFLHDIIEQAWGQRCFRIFDPDDNIIEFAEPLSVVVLRMYGKGITHNNIIKKTMLSKERVLNIINDYKGIENYILDESLIAPCGMNCGICLGFFGYKTNGEKRKMRCTGCKVRDKSCSFLKKFCTKLTKKEVTYCYECIDFPCKHLEKIDTVYRQRYNMSMIENLKNIRDNGIDSFLKQQEEIYQCPNCGSFICVHNNICYSCKNKNNT